MQKIIMLIGPPGAGKSYIANSPENPNSLESQGYKIFSSDKYREKLLDDVNNQRKNGFVYGVMHRDLIDSIHKGYNVVYDACNTKRRDRKTFFKIIEKNIKEDVEIIGIVFNISIEKCKEQNAKRDRNVPEYVIDRMFSQLTMYPPSIDEGFSKIYTSEEWLETSNRIVKNDIDFDTK